MAYYYYIADFFSILVDLGYRHVMSAATLATSFPLHTSS